MKNLIQVLLLLLTVLAYPAYSGNLYDEKTDTDVSVHSGVIDDEASNLAGFTVTKENCREEEKASEKKCCVGYSPADCPYSAYAETCSVACDKAYDKCVKAGGGSGKYCGSSVCPK